MSEEVRLVQLQIELLQFEEVILEAEVLLEALDEIVVEPPDTPTTEEPT